MYIPALHGYLECVQLAPASTAHHHAGPGGLATHTCDVIDRALRQRKSFELPLNGGPEIIFEQEHYWTYAVFIGALLHDIGKMATNTIIMLDKSKPWNPHLGSPLASGAKAYAIEFRKQPYKRHTQIANSFFSMIPVAGRGWLAQRPEIFSELCAWLYGDYYEFGVIGQIIRFADSQSVAANLKLGGERLRFSNAPEAPLVEKLMTALRDLIDSNQLKINGEEGSSGWCIGPITYLVCGTVADKVRSHLIKTGATDIPSDNTRLFDTWQEHGYAMANPSCAAIWKININGRMKLTVLKFETSRLFHPSRCPEAFSGSIIEVEVNGANTPVTNYPASGAKSPEAADIPTTTYADHSTPADDDHDNIEDEAKPVEDKPNAATTEQADDWPDDEYRDHVGNSYMVTPDDVPTESVQPTSGPDDEEPSGSAPNFQSKLPLSFDITDRKIGQYFLTWINESLQERSIQVNNSKALVHVVKEGALIVTPIAFKKFIWAFELCPEGCNMTKAVLKIQDRLRADMENKNLHRRTAAGINIHTYQVNGELKTAKVKCWLLPVKTVFGNVKPPSINPALENLSGIEVKKEEAEETGDKAQ